MGTGDTSGTHRDTSPAYYRNHLILLEKKNKMDMEIDIKNTPVILHKVRTNDIYAQNLYAALCNNVFVDQHDEEWSCSWRYAATIISDIRQQGDYLDWYLSGSSNDSGKVPEGTITKEITKDLSIIGYDVLDTKSPFVGIKTTKRNHYCIIGFNE